MDKILNGEVKPIPSPQFPPLLSQKEYPLTQYIKFDIIRVENLNENNEKKLTYATCNICSTFKGEGHVRQLCGKYACMKN